MGIHEESQWASWVFGSTSKQKRQMRRQLDLLTTINIYPTQAIWVIFKIIPLSVGKTTVGCEIYAAQNSPSLAASVEKLKETTFSQIERLQALQNQIVEGSLSLDRGTYDVLSILVTIVPITTDQIDQQNAVNALLIAHRKLERLKGIEIQPAARQIGLSGKGEEDINRRCWIWFSASTVQHMLIEIVCKTLENAIRHAGPQLAEHSSIPPPESLDW